MMIFLLRSRSDSSAAIPGSLSSSSLPPSFTPGRCATVFSSPATAGAR